MSKKKTIVDSKEIDLLDNMLIALVDALARARNFKRGRRITRGMVKNASI